MAKRQSKRSFRGKFLERARLGAIRAGRFLWGVFRFAGAVVALVLLMVSVWKLNFRGAERVPEAGAAGGLGGEVEWDPAIVIDAGHGGADGGTVANGWVERDLTLPIARRLAAVLGDRGHAVRMTRTTDETISLADRSAFANRGDTELFVSVHVNAGPDSVQGIETFFSSPKALAAMAAARAAFHVAPGAGFEDFRSELLAERIQEAVSGRTGARDRGAKNRASLSVTRHTHAPAVLVECGFLTHSEEAKRLIDPAYQGQLAEGIADGIEAYLAEAALDPYFGTEIGAPVEAAEQSVVDSR
ncbi:hypothetical protein BH23VER1_BH23VER1_16760 [soil metagenome]